MTVMEVLIDKHGANVEEVDTFLHEAQSPEEITAMLKSPLIDVNVTNKVQSLLLTHQYHPYTLSALVRAHSLITTPCRRARRRSKRMRDPSSCGRH